MKHFVNHLFGNFGSTLRYVCDAREDRGRGRLCMLLSGVLSGLIGQLSGGLFYTSFLLMYGIDQSRIAVLTFVPYITCLLSIFSPYILERFPKRRKILVAGKLLYYLVNILGITVMPAVVKNPDARLFWFIVLVITASAINQLIASGFSAWNANFLPDYVRVDYFSTASCIQNSLTYIIILLVSFVKDKLTGTPYESTMLITVRYVALALAIVDCIIWLIPKEYPYPRTTRVKLSNIFTLPIKNRRFFLTILILILYSFVTNFPTVTLNVYLLQNIKVSYTLVNAINALYFVFIIVFTRVWRKFIDKYYWFRSLALGLLIESFSYLVYSFLTEDRLWIYIFVRFTQHLSGSLSNLCINSLPYVNLPEEDRTCYLSFHTILTNVAVFFSLMLATIFTGIMGDRVVTLFHTPYTSTQFLMLATSIGQSLVALLSFFLSKKLTPPEVAERSK